MRLTIRQIENPRAGVKPKTLVLDGRAGPHDKLSWGGSQRGEVEWLPGSSVAAVRLDGPEERPTDFRFVWRGHDFQVGDATLDGVPLADLDSLVDALDTIRRDTALVEVEWRGRAQKAKITSFEADEGLAQQWEATLTVQWVEALDRPVRIVRRRSPRAFGQMMRTRFEEDTTGRDAHVTFARRPVETMESGLDAVRRGIGQIEAVALSATNAASSVVGVGRAMAATIQQVITASDEVAASAAVSSDTIAQTEDATEQIAARLFRSKAARAARRARHLGALERRHYRPESDVLAIHTAVAGETIWSVSRLYYGTPAHGPAIARRNNLVSTALRAGQRLVIPVLSALEAAS